MWSVLLHYWHEVGEVNLHIQVHFAKQSNENFNSPLCTPLISLSIKVTQCIVSKAWLLALKQQIKKQ